MENWPKHPVICELNTWVWLNQLTQEAQQPITLANVPEAELQRLSGLGFDGLWLMGVWRRSPAARRIAREGAEFQDGHRRALPDYTPEDIVGSAYAIFDYHVDAALGGDDGLAAFRKRLHACGLHLILDFVPNHLSRDHAWTVEHPERFVQGTEADLARDPGIFFRCESRWGPRVLAHGRDPYFPAWTDTAQLDYRRSETQQAMTDELVDIAARCDGVRCDMAMLENQDTFLKTWGGSFESSQPEFWLKAIPAVREKYPGFLFMAEVYWGLDQEEKLQRFGFDYTYDKRLYDLLLHGDAVAVRNRLRESDAAYQSSLVRFIENHDEERARTAFGLARSRAAAALALALSRAVGSAAGPARSSPTPESTDFHRPATDKATLPLLATTGLASLAMEVVWTRQYVPFLGPVVYSFAAMLASRWPFWRVASPCCRCSPRILVFPARKTPIC